jgi:hypothetical protein
VAWSARISGLPPAEVQADDLRGRNHPQQPRTEAGSTACERYQIVEVRISCRPRDRHREFLAWERSRNAPVSAAPKMVGESWKLMKGNSGHPIDACVALAMALVNLTAKKKSGTLFVWT